MSFSASIPTPTAPAQDMEAFMKARMGIATRNIKVRARFGAGREDVNLG